MGRTLHYVILAGMSAACGPASGTADWRVALDEVVRTELEFARLATDSTVQFAFMTWLADDGILFRPGPTSGPDWLAANPMPDDLRLEWQPAWADVSVDGSVGYTTGPWRSGRRRVEAAGGGGQYVTLWRRSPDGGYRAVLDFGTGNQVGVLTPDLELAAPPDLSGGPADPAAAAASVRIADEDLGDALIRTGSAAWPAYAHPAVRWLRDGAEPAIGADSPPNDSWGREFRTLGADAAGSGDLAWTWGQWQPAGEDRTDPAGHYLRIWRRQSDGSWRVVLEALNRSA